MLEIKLIVGMILMKLVGKNWGTVLVMESFIKVGTFQLMLLVQLQGSRDRPRN